MTAVNFVSQDGNQPSERPVWLTQSWLEPRLVVVTLLAIIASFISERAGAPDTLTLVLNVISYAAGGVFGAKTALESLLVERKIDVDMLMVLAAIGAAIIGEWHEGAILLFLFSLSNVLQDYAIGRSRSAIRSLFKLYPEEAKVRRDDGSVETVKISEIALGDVILIEPGERIPVDGQVIEGQSAIDESPITGESIPVDKRAGDAVFAGTLNKQGILDIEATKPASETTLARIIKMVEEAQDTKAPTERFLDRFEQVYALFILVSVGLFIVVPPLLGLVDFQSNFYRAMVLMTVASPCALVISVPASFIAAIASAARGGVLFKGSTYLESLAGVKAIAFDKTGTLTIGEPRVTEIVPYNGLTESDVLRLAAAVEDRSEHPLARAVVLAARDENIEIAAVTAFEATAGRGVHGQVNGEMITVGSLAHLQEIVPLPDELARKQERLENEGQTTMGVLHGERWAGIIAVADQLRDEAKPIIARLKEMGLAVAMLTGDNPRVAAHIAEQLGIADYEAGLMPEEKVEGIKRLEDRYGSVAMIGDGVNDAPALATATLGIAMGAAGTDVAMETADVVLMGDKLERLSGAITLAKRAQRVVWQNIIFSLGVIVVLVLGVFVIELPLPVGVLGHEGSTVIVVLNGLISLLLLPEIKRRRQGENTA